MIGQCEWSPDTESAVEASSGGHQAILNMFNIARGLIGRPSGGHQAILNMFNIARRRRAIGSRTCTTQLRIVINKTLSPYQPGSRTVLYDSLVPTDANGHIARHSANVNGVPVCRRDVGWFRPELPPTTSEPNRGIGSANVKRAM